MPARRRRRATTTRPTSAGRLGRASARAGSPAAAGHVGLRGAERRHAVGDHRAAGQPVGGTGRRQRGLLGGQGAQCPRRPGRLQGRAGRRARGRAQGSSRQRTRSSAYQVHRVTSRGYGTPSRTIRAGSEATCRARPLVCCVGRSGCEHHRHPDRVDGLPVGTDVDAGDLAVGDLDVVVVRLQAQPAAQGPAAVAGGLDPAVVQQHAAVVVPDQARGSRCSPVPMPRSRASPTESLSSAGSQATGHLGGAAGLEQDGEHRRQRRHRPADRARGRRRRPARRRPAGGPGRGPDGGGPDSTEDMRIPCHLALRDPPGAAGPTAARRNRGEPGPDAGCRADRRPVGRRGQGKGHRPARWPRPLRRPLPGRQQRRAHGDHARR